MIYKNIFFNPYEAVTNNRKNLEYTVVYCGTNRTAFLSEKINKKTIIECFKEDSKNIMDNTKTMLSLKEI